MLTTIFTFLFNKFSVLFVRNAKKSMNRKNKHLVHFSKRALWLLIKFHIENRVIFGIFRMLLKMHKNDMNRKKKRLVCFL